MAGAQNDYAVTVEEDGVPLAGPRIDGIKRVVFSRGDITENVNRSTGKHHLYFAKEDDQWTAAELEELAAAIRLYLDTA